MFAEGGKYGAECARSELEGAVRNRFRIWRGFLIATAVLFDAVWELFLGWFRKAACALRRRAI
ncbi:MAG: hypothetical protein HGA38_01525 [Candidatus Moranbacteria bacterium]|nr:hypothetical protein [Candidatus Moranbacteria bacterium]